MTRSDLRTRAERHAALGEPARLAIVDELWSSDRTPRELQTVVAQPSNLLAHHLDVLERVGLITRSRSAGDGRRRYVRLRRAALAGLDPGRRLSPEAALFACTANSARSQVAAVLWRRLAAAPAASAGTHPAERVHPLAVAAARRAGLDLADARPRHLDEIGGHPPLVITVCDRAHEELHAGPGWLHWSIPDPLASGTEAAFDATVAELRERMTGLLEAPKVA